MMRRMARPKTLDDATRKMVSLPRPLAEAVEHYRFNSRIKTESEAIRRLIEAGLAAQEKIPIRNRKPTAGAAESAPPKRRRSAQARAE